MPAEIPEIIIGVDISESEDDTTPKWRYEIGIKQEQSGRKQAYISYEKVWDGEKQILNRPDKSDKKDEERLQQTHLEQVTNNKDFREIGQYFDGITYTHLVPQLLRHSDDIQGKILEDDPFGQGFLDKIVKTPKRTRDSRFRRINEVIKVAVPKLKEINLERDEITGRPHLIALYPHWRKRGARQREDQFSDGTLRLIALIWSLLEKESLLLLEEPELSLHQGVVEKLSSLLYRAQSRKQTASYYQYAQRDTSFRFWNWR